MRRQLAGEAAIAAALANGDAIRLALVRRGASGSLAALAERLRAQGVDVRETSANDLRRMSATPEPCDALALVGPDPEAPLEAVFARPGPVWLLAGVTYAGNAGYAIRTAEVSGAEAICLDTPLDAAGRRFALRASMGAERFFPVRWIDADPVLAAARATGRRVVAIEDSGERAPYEVDLRGPVLLVIGGESRGIAPALLERCDAVLRIPMRGFVPAYNLQAALAIVAGERLRQEAGGVTGR
jgi:23S rRNA (guanosine2251-2'-O)-methyltransferase